MPGFHGTTRAPLASLKRRLPSLSHSTPSTVTFHLTQRTPAFISNSRGLYIGINNNSLRNSRQVGSDRVRFLLVSHRSFSSSAKSASTMDHNSTTSNGSSNHHSKTDNSSGNTTTKQKQAIYFGPFEVTNQVFLTTPHSFALVNLKPLLPGHVLVCPLRPAKRLTDLSAVEITDLFSSVQKVQRMLARHYFSSSSCPSTPTPRGNENTNGAESTIDETELCSRGSFNIAVQDGPEAGQTVGHVHVHVIPRIRGSTAKDVETPSDELYDRMAGEDGNVGGALWDRDMTMDGNGIAKRPQPGGQFPGIEDSLRVARGMEEMEREAEVFRGVLRDMEVDGA